MIQNKIIKILWLLILGISISFCKDNVVNQENASTVTDSLKLVWSDEFDVNGPLNSDKWDYDIGGNGWGNNELQYYTSDSVNVRVKNGNMEIESQYYPNAGIKYTSSRVVTRHKAAWTYGRIEIRAKLPVGTGVWPAIWMLPEEWSLGNGSWPDNGEIDIMEYVGYSPGNIHGTIHTHSYNHVLGTQIGGSTHIDGVENDFHVYAIEWDSSKIDFYVDSLKYFTANNDGSGWEGWPFFKDFYLVINTAIGGDWGGAQGIDNSIFPQIFFIDYVRIYKKE